MEHCTPIDHCLACGGHNLELKLDLHPQALANNYVKDPNNPELEFPLAVNLCQDCYHLQLTHAVDPEIIYKNYLYVSGTSKTMHDHCKWFARFAREYCGHWPTRVLDIGCNDGTQLDYFKKLGMTTYGIDPAENLYETSSKNHHIYCDFYNEQLVDQLVNDNLRPDLIVAQNSFAHNPDPYTYLVNLRRIMKPGSLFFVQTSQADMVRNNEFDTIYHEHINFYNINSMNHLCQRAGLHLVDVVKTPIHGTSYIFIISNTRGNPARIENLIAMEQDLLKVERYDQWANTVKKNVGDLVDKLEYGTRSGYVLVGYGAAAKGNTLLNFGKIKLDAIIDDNPLKQTLYTPGMKIPIVSRNFLTHDMDKIMFVPLAWNFYREIKTNILKQRSNSNDLFVKYFPSVSVEQ